MNLGLFLHRFDTGLDRWLPLPVTTPHSGHVSVGPGEWTVGRSEGFGGKGTDVLLPIVARGSYSLECVSGTARTRTVRPHGSPGSTNVVNSTLPLLSLTVVLGKSGSQGFLSETRGTLRSPRKEGLRVPTRHFVLQCPPTSLTSRPPSSSAAPDPRWVPVTTESRSQRRRRSP